MIYGFFLFVCFYFCKRCFNYDESHILPVQDIQIQSGFIFDEKPKDILDHEVKQLRHKQVPLVKVLWKHHGMEEATWDPESTIRAQYLQLFNSGINFEDEILLRVESCNTPNYTLTVL